MSASSLLNSRNIFIGIIAIILFAALYSYSFSKTHWYDGVDSEGSKTTKINDMSGNSGVVPSVALSNPGYKLQSINNPAELLPSDINKQWSTLNPSGKDGFDNSNLLQAGSHIGLDTIGNSNKNSCLDIRSCPLVPKVDVGPWNNSTIEPDIARVPFEIGQGLP